MSSVADALLSEPPVRTVREALAGSADEAWIVGGTIRDALLERPVRDVDVTVDGDPENAARAVARTLEGPVFPLSEAFGAWRAIDRAGGWVCDVSPLHGEGILSDLAQRDFTVNAMAMALDGGELVDPHGGRADVHARVLRVLGEAAYAADPLRPLRLARLATELSLAPDPETEELTRRAAPAVRDASGERIFAELRRLIIAERAVEGLELADRLDLTAAVLPELDALHGVEQSHFHHLDVHDHTLEVLRQQVRLEGRLVEVFGDLANEVAGALEEPLADELSRREALRFAALLHDVGKPATRGRRPDGRITFIGHDAVGEGLVADVCRRLRTSERLRTFIASITRHHLVLGFLVHERPLSRRTIYRYLATCQPVEVEVTVLSCADRLATRGRNAERAIADHLEVARDLMAEALRWRAEGAPPAPIRGDELAAGLGIATGPEIGGLLAELTAASFSGEVTTPQDALAYARRLRENAAR